MNKILEMLEEHRRISLSPEVIKANDNMEKARAALAAARGVTSLAQTKYDKDKAEWCAIHRQQLLTVMEKQVANWEYNLPLIRTHNGDQEYDRLELVYATTYYGFVTVPIDSEWVVDDIIFHEDNRVSVHIPPKMSVEYNSRDDLIADNYRVIYPEDVPKIREWFKYIKGPMYCCDRMESELSGKASNCFYNHEGKYLIRNPYGHGIRSNDVHITNCPFCGAKL